jgi:outer membrane lipoprotein SlyB
MRYNILDGALEQPRRCASRDLFDGDGFYDREFVMTSKSMLTSKAFRSVVITGLCAAITGCSSNAGNGALIGGAGGGLIGAGIGSMSHARAGEGALIGAAAGAIGGALIGGAMDKKEREEREAREAQDRADHTYSDREYRTDVSYSNGSGVTTQDVISWVQRGTRDEEIIDRINRTGTVFHLTAADENRLRDAGVSEMVIRAMNDTARR